MTRAAMRVESSINSTSVTNKSERICNVNKGMGFWSTPDCYGMKDKFLFMLIDDSSHLCVQSFGCIRSDLPEQIYRFSLEDNSSSDNPLQPVSVCKIKSVLMHRT